ncbi:MAG: NAD(P)/FAD-dependent oxidoreductase [Xanthomonadales bacterium]|nr:NAD(P)/FAD-dependent oxidoreductase [Xanthomonadales bacterium]
MSNMEPSKQVIIIGGGHNGLVCAAYLAKAGRQVTVLEAGEQVGGLAATREFAPGYRASCAHLLHLLDDRISRELELEAQGLKLARSGLATLALSPDGGHLTITGDRVEGPGLSSGDQAAYIEYRRFMSRFAGIIGDLHRQIPPRIRKQRGDLLSLGKLALKIRRLGRDDMREFLRIAGINIYDVLQENFDNPLLKGALSMDAVLGTFSGPRSNNSVFTALHRMSGNNGGPAGSISQVVGGMGSLTEAMAAAARKAGVEIRTGSEVRSILTDGDRVHGVRLVSGEELAAATVVSNADPRSTILDLLGARHVEAGFAKRISHLRARGTAAKLHLALDGLPNFAGVAPEQLGERLLIAPSLEYVELAFNHSKYGEYSAKPVAEITLPSVNDPGLAPAGKHVLSAIVQYAPRELGAGWSSGKTAFTEVVMDLLAEYAPDIKEKTVATELLTPEDLEKEYRVSGGHWHHGELSLDQFLMLRPVPKAAQYAMPVSGLYLCGAGSHPGGGVMGSAGRNAASAVLAQ